MAGDNAMTKDEFFNWCGSMGLRSNSRIAAVLSVSSQTIRNWRKPGGSIPTWIPLACAAYEDHKRRGGEGLPDTPVVTVTWFEAWQRRNGLCTYEDTGAVFGLSRQGVHNWFRRSKFPGWIPMACLGYECLHRDTVETA